MTEHLKNVHCQRSDKVSVCGKEAGFKQTSSFHYQSSLLRKLHFINNDVPQGTTVCLYYWGDGRKMENNNK